MQENMENQEVQKEKKKKQKRILLLLLLLLLISFSSCQMYKNYVSRENDIQSGSLGDKI